MLKRPLLAVFRVNLRCNSSCGYCNLPLNEGRYEMSREEIRNVFADLYKDGLRFVFVQGGEPLLRRDLPDILQDLVELGFHLTVIRNGTKLTPHLVQQFDDLSVSLSISLDTLNRNRYERIRGADQPPAPPRGPGPLYPANCGLNSSAGFPIADFGGYCLLWAAHQGNETTVTFSSGCHRCQKFHQDGHLVQLHSGAVDYPSRRVPPADHPSHIFSGRPVTTPRGEDI